MKEFKKAIKYATIDIGSNAIRLLISNIYIHNSEQFSTKNSLVRVPIRLGQDAFKSGDEFKINNDYENAVKVITKIDKEI